MEVGLVVPDAELSVVGERVAEEPTVVGGAGEGNGFLLCLGIDDGLDMVAEGSCGRVEIDAAEVIADGVKTHFRPLPVEGGGNGAGGTEIKRTSVGREDGEGLVDGVLFEQGREDELVFLDVVNLNVGGFIEHLDAVGVGTVEELTRGVGGIGDIAARGMPVGIDAETEGLVGFGFVSVERTILTFDL